MTNNIVIQSFGELPSARKSSVRLVVENLLQQEKVFNAVQPYFVNGGICGHKVMDIKGAVDLLRKADANAGSQLPAYNLNDFQLGNVLKNALRSRYALDKTWKIVGLNPKVAALLEGPSHGGTK